MNYEPKKEEAQILLNIFYQKNYRILINKITDLLKRYPKSVFLLNLLGSTYNELNEFEKAINCFNEIIKLNKNFADAYYNLGIIYKKINKLEDAENNYTLCININPNKYEAYNNLGNIYKDRNDTERAINNYLKCLDINSNYLIGLQNFGVCLQNFSFSYQSNAIDKHIINLLKQDKILRPVDIINSLINYLYLDLEFKDIVENIDIIYNKIPIEELINKILNFKVFLCIIKITPITDVKIENLLKFLRRILLLNIDKIKNNNSALELISAIAKQCFINEYLYSSEMKEKKTQINIENYILKKIKEKKYNECTLEITCLASYKSLVSYKWSKNISGIREIAELIKLQISEPNIEKALRKKILYKKINDSVSLKVKNQYEESPYPRWIKIALSKPDTVLNYSKNRNLYINNKVKNWTNIDVLVAGCGTGQHAITTATKFKNSFITAIDLSSKSLSYAKRKANDLGIKNIDFIQMDILDLEDYGKKFEIIESVGVLHHMKNPLLGWQILSQILKPNGLLMIGLYSSKARTHIKELRTSIKNISNSEDIKSIREKLILIDNKNTELIKQSPDFYSLSSVRDLLFHVQENTFTISEIENNIKELNLKFCGFENREIINKFRKIYPKNEDLYNLSIWNDFENKNKRVFAGMYQFWCQKL